MGSIYLKKELKKLFLAVFREIFAVDPDFLYNKNDILNSSILISSRYATPKTEDLMPQIIVSVANYTAGKDSLLDNFYKESPGLLPGTVTKREHTNIVQFQVQIDVLSSVRDECETISDKVFNLLNHECSELMLKLGLNIRDVSVGEASPKDQYPRYSFVAPVTIVGALRLQWSIGKTEEAELQQKYLLKNIKVSLSTDDFEF